MMSFRQYKLLKLMEECTEVAKRASKQMQFGDRQHQPEYLPNRDRLREELLDLRMWEHILMYYDIISPITDRDVRDHYYNKFSRLMGTLEEAIAQGQVDPSSVHHFPEHL